MNPKYLYLLINLGSISIPLLFSFHKKANFSKTWKYLFISTVGIGLVFILWDVAFTHAGYWGFNEKYILGTHLFNLPLEEVLFFVCIPYACVFTYFALTHLIEKDYLFPHQELISSLLSVVLMFAGLFFINKPYTGITFLLTGGFLAFQMIVLRPRYMGRFYFAFAVLLVPFLIINGILTGSFIGEPVVWYNNDANLGIRIGTIPIEDFFYAMLLIVTNISVYEWLQYRALYR